MLKYSIAIATRNRAKALALSIPRMVRQSLPPSQIVVSDSSDDHGEIRETVLSALGNCGIDTEIVQAPRGAVIQRNVALRLVKHPIVLFPDDDSIWFEDTARHIVAVYDADPTSRISAVCGAESFQPPDDFEGVKTSYKMKPSDRLRRKVALLRLRFEKYIARDPAAVLGEALSRGFQPSSWESENDVVPVPWMTGFRMSFRTEYVRRFGFNENLRDYSLFEDIDASIAAWKLGGVVAARNARVFHYKSPERRGDGWTLGVTQLLNKAYLVIRHTPTGHPARASVLPFARFKLAQYLAGIRSDFGRLRLRGASAAYSKLGAFLRVSPEHADESYRELLRLLATPSSNRNSSLQ